MIYARTGDATAPVTKPAVIAHVCNNLGLWGAGFVLAISKRWKAPEQHYLQKTNYHLGSVDYIAVEIGESKPNIIVANMIAQNGLKSKNNPVPLSYDDLHYCLLEVGRYCQEKGYYLHMPKIGCGLAGGDWSKVKAMIQNNISESVGVYLYDFDGTGI